MIHSDLLLSAAGELGIELTAKQSEDFAKYLRELEYWNKKINLTSLNTERDIILKHFIDSIAICPYIPDRSVILDIGSGAGFPGIPLSIVRPDTQVILLESREKRVYFLKHIIRVLDLLNTNTVRGRAEDKENGVRRGTFDIVTCRAFSNVTKIIQIGRQYLKKTGRILLMRGQRGIRELNEIQMLSDAVVDEYREITIPYTDHRRVIVIVKFK